MVFLAQLSMVYYINLVRPVEPSATQCYKMSRQILQCTKLLLTVYSTAQYFWVMLYYIHPVNPVEPSATKCQGRSYSAARCKSWLQPLRALIVCHRQTASCEEMGWNAQETLTFIRSSHCLPLSYLLCLGAMTSPKLGWLENLLYFLFPEYKF